MKKIFMILASLLLSASAMAGDGGFLLQTCVSSSGRTNLTIFQDFWSGANVEKRVVLGIDGEFLTYQPQKGQCELPDGRPAEDDCLNINVEPSLTVNQGDSILLSVTFGDGNTASIEPGFFDPRPYKRNVKTGRINLTCKEFYQVP